MSNQQFIEHLTALNEAQLRQVFARLLMELDPEAGAIDSQEDLDWRLNLDTLLLRDVARVLEIPVQATTIMTRDEASVQLLELIAQQFPQYRQTLWDAIDEASQPDVHLDFGLSIAIGVLIIATAAAIARPHVVVVEKREKTKEKEKIERKVEVKAEGVNDIAQVIKTVLPFL